MGERAIIIGKIILVMIIIIILSSRLGFSGWESVRARLKKKRGVEGGAAPPAGGVGGGGAPPHLQMVVILKIGLAWFFWVWLRSYYKKPQKKHRNAKTEPFKVSYCFEDCRTTLKIGLACLFGFGFVRDTKT